MFYRRIAAACAALVAMIYWTSASADVVTCESADGRDQFCAAETRGGVTLQTQLSRAPCREGESWGWDRRGIWTANGCRAQFIVGSSQHHDSSSSGNSNANAAAAVAALAIVAAGAAAVHHHDQKERRDRDRDDYYSYDYAPSQSYGHSRYGGGDQTLRCDSEDGRQRYCPADTRSARVELTRQYSRSECRFGRNWGYDRRGIWVNGGCRGEFAVYRY